MADGSPEKAKKVSREERLELLREVHDFPINMLTEKQIGVGQSDIRWLLSQLGWLLSQLEKADKVVEAARGLLREEGQGWDPNNPFDVALDAYDRDSDG